MKRIRTLSALALTGALLTACSTSAPMPTPTPTPTADTTKPTVTLNATPTSFTSGGAVALSATASDNVGVTEVAFYRGTTLISTDTTAPYEASDAVTGALNGTVTYRAVARDAAGNTAEATKAVTVTIDATAPTVALTVTPTVLTMPGTVTFKATASDNVAVTRVEFLDNGTLVATGTAAPYSASKTYAFADNGNHVITARAYDAQGNVTESTVTITVAIADANEPNDSVATATALSIGTPLSGFIAGQNRDMDYFKFSAAAGDMLKLNVRSVSVNPKSTLDPYVMILMPDGKTVLEQDDDSGAGLESEIRFNAPVTGTYTVVVTSFKIYDDPVATDNLATNTYQIALTRR